MELKNKTVIVTGANTGIGYETALGLAKKGARVILACRDEKKGFEACEKIKLESENNQVEVELLDLSRFNSIRSFCDRIKAKLNNLHILINNAGLFMGYHSKTEDGYETTFQVNYLGPYYLTRFLIDLIVQSAPSRIINLSSSAHKGIEMNWDDLQSDKNYGCFSAYRQTKLANILFTNELADRLKDKNVIVVSLHPGVVKTDIMRIDENALFSSRLLYYFGKLTIPFIGISAAQGALTSIYCSISNDIISGAYYDDSEISSASAQAENSESAKKLWRISAKLCNLDD